MKRTFVPFLLLAAAAVMAPLSAQDYPTELRDNGLGPLEIGMNIEGVERALRAPTGYNAYNNRGCSTLTTKALEPTGISLTIISKVLVRINVDFYAKDPRPLAIKTAAGIGLTSSEEDLLKAYPNARIKRLPADPSWHTIFVDNADRTMGMVFETDGKSVKSIRVGQIPDVYPATACS